LAQASCRRSLFKMPKAGEIGCSETKWDQKIRESNTHIQNSRREKKRKGEKRRSRFLNEICKDRNFTKGRGKGGDDFLCAQKRRKHRLALHPKKERKPLPLALKGKKRKEEMKLGAGTLNRPRWR